MSLARHIPQPNSEVVTPGQRALPPSLTYDHFSSPSLDKVRATLEGLAALVMDGRG
jgi:hypothetical protein